MEEGIFRLSGRISEINALKEEYNRFNGGVNISKFTEDVHSATGKFAKLCYSMLTLRSSETLLERAT